MTQGKNMNPIQRINYRCLIIGPESMKTKQKLYVRSYWENRDSTTGIMFGSGMSKRQVRAPI